jgi:hypothetical protein
MTRNEAKAKGIVKKAVQVKLGHPTLSISEVMRVAKVSNF